MVPFISVGAKIGWEFNPERDYRHASEIVALGEAAAFVGDLTEGLVGCLNKLALMASADLPPEQGQIELSLEMLESAAVEIENSLGILRSIRRG